MRYLAWTLVLVVGILPFIALPQSLGGVAACQEVRESTFLSSDLETTGKCINVVASDLVLTCDGYTITGPGVTNTGQGQDVSIAIYGRGVSNVTIANCTLRGVDYGILFEDSRDITLLNNTVENYFQAGFLLTGNGGQFELRRNNIGPGAASAIGVVLDGDARALLRLNEFDSSLPLAISIRGHVKARGPRNSNSLRLESMEVEEEASFEETEELEEEKEEKKNKTAELNETDLLNLSNLTNFTLNVSDLNATLNSTGLNGTNETNATAGENATAGAKNASSDNSTNAPNLSAVIDGLPAGWGAIASLPLPRGANASQNQSAANQTTSNQTGSNATAGNETEANETSGNSTGSGNQTTQNAAATGNEPADASSTENQSSGTATAENQTASDSTTDDSSGTGESGLNTPSGEQGS